MRDVIAKAGERVTDENGNTVCFVAESITSTTRLRVANFRDWTIPTPQVATLIDRTPGFRTQVIGGARIEICIEGEWR
jgi:hypothetical protein